MVVNNTLVYVLNLLYQEYQKVPLILLQLSDANLFGGFILYK